MIERGQADAIRLMRSSVNQSAGTATANEPMEANATNTSGVPPMVFVDDKGLEEQFLTDGEDTGKRFGHLSKLGNNTSEYNSDKPKYPTDATRGA